MPAGRFTVPAVLDQRAEQFGDRVMMSIAGTPVTFAQMRDRSCAAANVLAGLGVNRGETVALFTGTCPEWVYFWLGAARIGAVAAAVSLYCALIPHRTTRPCEFKESMAASRWSPPTLSK